MTNFTSKIFGNAISSLNAQQAQIAVTSNNIANVNTPGYSRRLVDVESRGASFTGLAIGNGVQIVGVRRISDLFLERLMRQATTEKHAAQVEHEFLGRVENIYNLTGQGSSIGGALTAFWGGLNDLSANPASIELRSHVLERATDLVQTINNGYNYIANLQNEADQRIRVEINTVNSITKQIAKLNALAQVKEASGSEASEERDQRNRLMEQLGERIGFSALEQADGTVTISLANGFSLVNGANHRALELTQTPTYGNNLPPSLSGPNLTHIVFDYGIEGSPAHIDAGKILAQGGGTIGGLLRLRGVVGPEDQSAFDANGYLVEVASQIESITRNLLTHINDVYNHQIPNPDYDPGDPSSGPEFLPGAFDLNGNSPGPFGFFNFNFDGPGNIGDYSVGNHPGVINYSSIIQVAISDPAQIAAARLQSAPGDNQNLVAMIQLQGQPMTFAVGNFSISNATFAEAYSNSVTYVGNLKSRAKLNEKVSQDNFVSASNKRDEVSAVSLDEEFTNLIKFQRAFQASARMIRAADEIMERIVNLI
jgi:flagellar hook-associated protein 1 FlgK